MRKIYQTVRSIYCNFCCRRLILDTIDKGIVLDHYHDFRNKIDEKFNLVDNLVKEYSLRIQPKIRKTQDKMVLIKV